MGTRLAIPGQRAGRRELARARRFRGDRKLSHWARARDAAYHRILLHRHLRHHAGLGAEHSRRADRSRHRADGRPYRFLPPYHDRTGQRQQRPGACLRRADRSAVARRFALDHGEHEPQYDAYGSNHADAALNLLTSFIGMFWQGEVQMTRSSAALAVAIGLLPATVQAQTIEEKAQACSACHGENGVPQQKDHPVIWGQQLGYLFIELRDFKVGARKNDLMSPIAQSLDPTDLMPLAQYFSQKAWPNLGQPPATGDVLAQAQRANGSIVCTSCHQEGFKGDRT